MSGILIDLFIVLIILSISYMGYRKGLTSVLYKIIVFIVSLLIVFVLYKPVANIVIKNTKIDDNIATTIKNVLPENIVNAESKIEENDSKISNGSMELINKYISEAIEKSEQNIVNYVATKLSYIVVQIGTIIVLYIASNIILFVLKFAIDIVVKLPIISTFNQAGGLIYGVIKSFLIIYIILAILSLLSPMISSWGIIEAIEDSFLGSRMYNNNVLVNLIIK